MSDLDTLLARMTSAGALRVYKIGAVPASPATPYAVLSLDAGNLRGTRADGRSLTRARRLAVQVFGPSIDSVLHIAGLADAAFSDVVLTDIDGDPYSVREVASPVYRDPDGEGLLALTHTYRF